MNNVAELIEEFCEIHDHDECYFYGNYSGRGMFGKQCVGIVCRDNLLETIVKLCDYLYDCEVESVADALGNICRDSLGKDTIIYFPSISA